MTGSRAIAALQVIDCYQAADDPKKTSFARNGGEMSRRLTTDEFVEKAKAVHGDRYDYSSVNYVKAHTKVTITCSQHGPFTQTPAHHLSKSGCPDCGLVARATLQRNTTKDFIEKAVAVHGARYDYSKVEYLNNHTKVSIICPKHGPFPQAPSHHLLKKGCPHCAGTKLLTAEQFIEKAKAVHGDRYDYSQVEYVNNRTKVTIVCLEHGPFEQDPNGHLSKRGCRDCGAIATATARRLTTEDFVEKAIEVHGERYDYSQVEYVNSRTKVVIICPEHGPFEQQADNHLFKQGCPNCGAIAIGVSKRHTKKDFIEKAKAVHGDRYDYSQVEYVGSQTKVVVICPEHGPFEQNPVDHLSKKGCRDCGAIATATVQRHSIEDFIEKAIALHGERYDYSQIEYVNSQTKVTIICPEHGPFEQIPNSHIRKSGCPACADYGFNPNDRATLYYLAITTDDGDIRYKIGITNRNVEERFIREDPTRLRIVWTKRYAIGRKAAEQEAEILSQYAGDKYNGPDILRDGNTELFTHDILGLDK